MGQKKAWITAVWRYNGPDSASDPFAQRNRLGAYAKEHGFEVVGTSSDIASGLNFGHRTVCLEFRNGRWMECLTFLLVCDLSCLGEIWTGPCNTGICFVISMSASIRPTAAKWI